MTQIFICVAASSGGCSPGAGGRSKHMGSDGLRLVEDDLHQIIGSPPQHDVLHSPPCDLIGPGQPVVDLDQLVQQHMGKGLILSVGFKCLPFQLCLMQALDE